MRSIPQGDPSQGGRVRGASPVVCPRHLSGGLGVRWVPRTRTPSRCAERRGPVTGGMA
jgi:hypothetical protein